MTGHHPAYDLRRRYHARVRKACVAAVVLHGIVFAAAPPYAPRPVEQRTTPLRLVALSGGWGVASADADAPSRAGIPPVDAPSETRSLPPGASMTESRVTTESAATAISPVSTGATFRGGAEVQGRARSGEGGGVEEEGPPVFYNFDTAPRAIRRVEPEYPAGARDREEEGSVMVNVNIDERGQILRAWIAAKQAPESLVQAALDAAYQFRFTPGKQRGIPVKCTVAIPFRFSLRTVR